MWKEETVDRKDDQNQLAINLPMYRATCHTLDAIIYSWEKQLIVNVVCVLAVSKKVDFYFWICKSMIWIFTKIAA